MVSTLPHRWAPLRQGNVFHAHERVYLAFQTEDKHIAEIRIADSFLVLLSACGLSMNQSACAEVWLGLIKLFNCFA
jgi:hypothetical protein